jgi:hypothetical protein
MKREDQMKPESATEEAQFRAVVQLMHLKRHEQPDPDFDARNAAAIRTRIAALPDHTSWLDRLWGVFEQTPAPAFRYAMATALVVLVGYSALNTTLMPGQTPLAVPTNDTPALAQAAEPVPMAQTNLAPESYGKPVFVFEAPSNRSVGHGSQYGTGPAVPVRFDY